ncbi:hypothetical protein KJ910_04400 [Patescibacteria group bacterium]|nr:hypothetical protein [Patescibacteria group bacterium]
MTDFNVLSSGQIYLESQQAAANAIQLFASNAAGGIDIDAGTGGVTIDQVGAGTGISLDAASASNFTTSAGLLTLSGAGGVTVTSTGGTLTLNGTGQTVDLDATTLDVDATTMAFDTTAAGAAMVFNLNNAANTTFDVNNGGAGNANMTVDGTITSGASILIDGVSATRTITSDAAMNIAAGAGTALTIFGGDNGADAGENLVMTGLNLGVTATGAAQFDDDLTVDGGNVNFGAATTIGDGGDALTIDSNGTLIVDDATLRGSGAFSVTSNGATAMTVDAGGAAALNLGNANATSVVLGNVANTATITLNDTNDTLTFTQTSAGMGNDLLNAAAEIYSNTGAIGSTIGGGETSTSLVHAINAVGTFAAAINYDFDGVYDKSVANANMTMEVDNGDLEFATSAANDFGIDVVGASEFRIEDDGSMVFNVDANGLSTFYDDLDLTFVATENLGVTNTTGTNSVNVIDIAMTNTDAAANTQYGMNITDDSAVGSTEALIYLDKADGVGAGALQSFLLINNLDTNLASSAGVVVQSANGGITNAFDASDNEITNALNVGANVIYGTGGATIDFDNFDVANTGLVTIGGGGLTTTDGTTTNINSNNITIGDDGTDIINFNGTVNYGGKLAVDVTTGDYAMYVRQQGAGDGLQVVKSSSAAGRAIWIDADSQNMTDTNGMFDLDVWTATSAVEGISLTYTAKDDDAADTMAAQLVDVTIEDDTTANDTVSALQLSVTNNDANTPIVRGLYVPTLSGTASTASRAIFQEGTGWGYGLYVEDDAYFGLKIEGVGNVDFADGVAGDTIDIGDVGDTVNISGGVALSGTTSESFGIDNDSVGAVDVDVELWFSDDGNHDAHQLYWDDGNSEFRFESDAAALENVRANSFIAGSSGTLDTDSLDWSGVGEITTVGALTLNPSTTVEVSKNMNANAGIDVTGAITGTTSIDVDGAANLADTTAGADVTMGNSTGNLTFLSDNADFTLTDATDNVFQIVSSAAATLFDIDLGAADAITIGDNSTTIALNSSDWDINATGDMTGIGGINGASGEFVVTDGTGALTINDDGNLGSVSVEGSVLDIDSLTFVGAGTIGTTGATALGFDTGGAAAINIGAANANQVTITPNLDAVGGLDVTGAITGTTTIDVDGAANISDTTAGADVTMGNSTGNLTFLSDNADFTLTDATDNVFQIVSSAAATLFDIDLGAADAITIGDNSTTIALNSSDWDINATGDMTGIGGITSNGAIATTSTLDVDGATTLDQVTIDTTDGAFAVSGGNNITLDATAANIDIGNTAAAQINIGTAVADNDINIGEVTDNVAILSDSWSVTDAGVGTLVSLTTPLVNTADNAATQILNIPVSGVDAGLHTLSLQIDGNTGLSIAATGDGVGGVGVRTIQAGVSAAADIVTIGDANADVSITDANWSITAAGAAVFTGNVDAQLGLDVTGGALTMGAQNITGVGTNLTATAGLTIGSTAAAMLVDGGTDLSLTATEGDLTLTTDADAGDNLIISGLPTFAPTVSGDYKLYIDTNGDKCGEANCIFYTTTDGADLAEYYASQDALTPGDIVSVDRNNDENVALSSGAQDADIVGVVSTEPWDVMGTGGEGKYAIALAGNVPVKVTDENGPIAVGDYITSASTPGYGMKAESGDPTVGVALQPLASGTGTVNVLISRNNGSLLGAITQLQGSVIDLQNAGGAEDMATMTVDNLMVRDHLYASADMAGRVLILAGDTYADVTFEEEYAYQPIVTATQRSSTNIPGYWWISDEDTAGFRLNLDGTLPYDAEFNWIAVGVDGGKIFVSDNSTREIDIYVEDGGAPPPVVEEPPAEEPPAEEPPAEEPPAEEPPVEEPPVEEPPVEEPPVVEPPAEEPPAEEPPAEEPPVVEPPAEEPPVEEPPVEEPPVEEPPVEEPPAEAPPVVE